MKIYLTHCLIMVSLLFTSLGIHAQIILDDSFEQGATSTGWEVYKAADNANDISYSYADYKTNDGSSLDQDGKQSLKVTVNTFDNWSKEYIRQYVTLKPNTEYVFSLSARTDEDLDTEHDIQIMLVGKDKSYTKYLAYDLPKNWTQKVAIFNSSDSGESLEIRVRIRKAGSFYVDRLVLTEVGTLDTSFENSEIFESGVSNDQKHWFISANSGYEGEVTFPYVDDAFDGNRVARVHIKTANSGSEVQLKTKQFTSLNIQDNTDYKISFYAKKDVSNNGEEIVLKTGITTGWNALDSKVLTSNRNYTLTTDWEKFEWTTTFTNFSEADVSKLYMNFRSVTEDAIFYVDKISIEPISSDATLSAVTVAGEAIEGFAAGTLTYDVEILKDEVPAIETTTTDDGATVKVTNAASVPGSSTIEVTAEDGVTVKTYTLNFTVAFDNSFENENWSLDLKNGANASLTYITNDVIEGSKALKVDITAGTGTNGDCKLKDDMFSLGLKDNTDYIMSFSAKANIDDYGLNIAVANSASGYKYTSKTITQDWSNQSLLFTTTDISAASEHFAMFRFKEVVTVHIDNIYIREAFTDVTLLDLTVDGETVDGFRSNKYTYDVELPYGTESIPVVSWGKSNTNSTTVKTNAVSLPGSTTVEVTAEDGTTKATYTINFTIAPPPPFDGSFENEDWDLVLKNDAAATLTYTGDAQEGTQAAKVDVTNVSSAGDCVLQSVSLDNLELKDDTEYKLKFYAKAGADNTDLKFAFSVGYNDAEGKDDIKYTSKTLTTDWEAYNVTLELKDYSNAELKAVLFRFPTATTYYIDNVTISSETADTWDGSTWSTGEPTYLDDVVIAADYTGAGFVCNNLTVNADQTLDIGNGTLDVKGDFVNNGIVIIKSGASLLTYEGTNFTGNDVSVMRNTRYSGGQYSFVGSVVKQNDAIKGKALGKAIYKYDETVDYGSDEEAGINRWVKASKDVLIAGKGYTQAYKQILTFKGEPNNGDITYTGTYTDRGDTSTDGWNLVANPYAAGIDIHAFLTQNANIDGSVYLWDDNGSDVERGTNADYVVINAVGVSTGSRKGGESRLKLDGGKPVLGAGQGFFVRVTDAGKSKDITFKEDMRKGGLNADDNFFREAVSTKQTLNLSIESMDKVLYSSTLIGFLDDATTGEDRMYDAKQLSASNFQLYSILNDKHYAIQGLPFVEGEQIIPLGMNIAEAGTYTVDISEIENLSENVVVELIDTQLNVVHNLTESGIYTFSSDEVIEDTRFVLNVKENKPVISGIEDTLAEKLQVKASLNGLKLFGNSVYNVSIMDMTGRQLLNKRLENTGHLPYKFAENQLYIIKVNSKVIKAIF